nr:AAA family ATPase [Mycoplasma sp. 'Moose RK']
MKGENILVDACIGSGKTTVIQALCNEFPLDKKILYLTYNRLLKVDAKSKIINKNVFVQNYHGFSYWLLIKEGVISSSADAIKIFLTTDIPVGIYDVLLLDEYQDITDEISRLLERIKRENPKIQIVAVGDMEQKIYDNTRLNVKDFIDKFLESYKNAYLTLSFRMPKEHASMLGRIWKKEINGVNENCQIQYMKPDEVNEFLSRQKPSDILCLGARWEISDTLNYLEENHNKIFNKRTVYASIKDDERNLNPKKNSAIFTTYDSSKGLERPICVIFSFELSYWEMRLGKNETNYEILRNIFCVAASRGKEKIIFVTQDKKILLDENTLKNGDKSSKISKLYSMSTMFDHKYDDDIENMRQMLDVKEIYTEDKSEIKVKTNDFLINLAPCIGIFLEASYFNDFQIENEIKLSIKTIENGYFSEKYKNFISEKYKNFIKERKSIKDLTLFKVYLDTRQERYITQAFPDFIDDNAINKMHKRLSEVLSKNETVQANCSLCFANGANDFTMNVIGIADVVKNNIVYELKFVNDLTNSHFLQTASYMLALNLDTGILWNIRNNKMYQIKIKNREDFRTKLAQTITKGYYENENEDN